MQSMLIFETVGLKEKLLPLIDRACRYHNFETHDVEFVYDWFVTRAISNVLQLVVKGHVRNLLQHDVLEVMYVDHGLDIELYINDLFLRNQLRFFQNEVVKVLVTYRDIIIVRNL